MRRTRGHCRGIGLVAVSLLVGNATSAWADSPPKAASGRATVAVSPNATAAKKLLASAEAKRASGDFEGALADYQASDAIAASPATVEGIAFCHDKLGHFVEALTWYDGFLSSAPSSMQAQADAARARVEAIKTMPGHLHLESNPPNAVVTVDGKEQSTHTPLDVDLAPGKHLVHLTSEGHDGVDKEVEVASRAKESLAVELPVAAPLPTPAALEPSAAPPAPPPPRSLIPAIVTGGLAIVATGIGTGFGIAALSDKSNFNNHPTTATANTGEDHALVADMSFGIALTLGVTSVVLFTTRAEPATPTKPAAPSSPAGEPTPQVKPSALFAPDESPRPSTASLPITFSAAPFLTSHGGGAGAALRF